MATTLVDVNNTQAYEVEGSVISIWVHSFSDWL